MPRKFDNKGSKESFIKLSRSKIFEFSLIQKFRQCTYRTSGFDPEAPYSVDDPPFCQEINQIALDNALEALGRFSEKGP